jgi:hypothetical protein
MTKAEEYIKSRTIKGSNEICLESDKREGNFYLWLTPDDARKAIEIAKNEKL